MQAVREMAKLEGAGYMVIWSWEALASHGSLPALPGLTPGPRKPPRLSRRSTTP